jgi:hypothetical protein
MAVRGPARFAAAAWENNRRLPDHKFYYPRTVFDGNVARLGELRDQTLVRDIAYLYAILEQAREEGRRLEAGTSDNEGMLRYVNFLCSAYVISLKLVLELTSESQRFNAINLQQERDFINETNAKILKAALSSPKSTK